MLLVNYNHNLRTPRVAIVDAEEERLSFMDWQFSR